MISRLNSLKLALQRKLDDLNQQGHDTTSLGVNPLAGISSYDDIVALAERMTELPMRTDWPYIEPDNLEEIEAQSSIGDLPPAVICKEQTIRTKIRAGFLGSVCGCILGKPVEMRADMATLQKAAEAVNAWPLDDYILEEMLDELPRRHRNWSDVVRGKINYAAPDDDINYTVIGMLLLEEFGTKLTPIDVLNFWLHNLPGLWTFGPERNTLMTGLVYSQYQADLLEEFGYMYFKEWNDLWNFYSELCGAQIRADAYGYAFPGDPVGAARMAYVDASLTHKKTGVYATMFTAAAISLAFSTEDKLDIFRQAAKVVPVQSRFRKAVEHCIDIVAGSNDWLEAFSAIQEAYEAFGHCHVIQETGTLINSVYYGENTNDTFCKQVMQGNDTDSYGATSGAISGVYYGPDGLDPRWLEPFQDTIHTTIANFHEQSLTAVADRMAELPRKVNPPS